MFCISVLFHCISLSGIAWSLLALIFLAYLIPHFVITFLKPKDLKKAYSAKWGLVTGASSGALAGKEVVLYFRAILS